MSKLISNNDFMVNLLTKRGYEQTIPNLFQITKKELFCTVIINDGKYVIIKVVNGTSTIISSKITKRTMVKFANMTKII